MISDVHIIHDFLIDFVDSNYVNCDRDLIITLNRIFSQIEQLKFTIEYMVSSQEQIIV